MEKSIIINFEEFNSISELNLLDQDLIKKAYEATKLSYAPYSNFNVGVAALLDNGEIILGANQENSSFSATICAERVALSTISSLYSNNIVTAIAVNYRTSGVCQDIITPCGVCRQSLLEYEDRIKKPIRLLFSSPAGQVITFQKVSDLIPLGFVAKNLQ